MARWEPDARQRLQQAAMELFAERGYADVTIAEIADRAGLTKRTFFNHFADKREVLFAGAQAFETSVVRHLTEAGDGLSPIDSVLAALTRAGLGLAQYGEFALARRELIASTPDLQERDLIKMASLAVTIANTLRGRGVPDRIATFTAQAAVTAFTVAYDDWTEDTTVDFPVLMRQALSDLRHATCGAQADREPPGQER
ncbi:helix-turn-helix domain-containing protein [Amycolatopsis sp. NPDC024027]|uniref:TetR/AcrR family transcriptional regulator n=1 Tax=Amycolatopsis sp. NPDC024027 TaxID=3154327 RepID=UPI003409CD92